MKRSAARHAAASSLSLLAAVLALAASCADSTATSGACPESQTACGGRCVDLQASADHCGACGHACPDGSACAQGACVTACELGAVSCDGLCVDPLTDMAHCGACGVACAEGGACVDGVCLAACPPERTLCGDACVDTQVSAAHCGACDAPCDPGDVCVAGACQACPPGLEECAGTCADTQTSNQHCGGCGLSCAPGYQCEGGACQSPCGAGLDYCAGACVDTQTNGQHCGGCYQECFGGQICDAGACACPTGACGVCSVTDLGSIAPQTVYGDTYSAPDGYTPGCGPSGSPDVAFTFTAPEGGAYVFSTAGSSYNTVLAVTDAGCAELACNDDHAFGWESRATVDLVQGQSVVVIVDGYFDLGFFTLSVAQQQPPVCPVADLGSAVPQTITGTTLGHGDALAPSCGSSASGDASYTFTAPVDGDYLFHTFGSSFDTVLHVRDATCSGPELACNDNSSGPQSLVMLPLTAGQTVVVAVDGAGGAEGDFSLYVNQGSAGVCDPAGFCGDSVSGCIECAINGPCAGQYDACLTSNECIDYVTCIGGCAPGDQACINACLSMYPIGGNLYTQLEQCAICDACTLSCAGMASCP